MFFFVLTSAHFTVMQNHTNLVNDDVEDLDYDDGEDLTDAVLRLGIDDDSAFGGTDANCCPSGGSGQYGR
jgi:hypothetical protein